MDNLYKPKPPIDIYRGVVFMGILAIKNFLMYLLTMKKIVNDAASITIGKVIALVIVIYVIVALLPDAIGQLVGMNSTGNATVDLLFQALGVIIALVIFAGIAKEAE
jgi:hypothetical protein